MPRKKNVNVSYQKARQTPSARRIKPKVAPPKEPNGLSPLAAYIEENRAPGITVRELIEQFQEFDCDHPEALQRVVAQGTSYQHVFCAKCNRVEKRTARGTVKEDDG